MNDLAWLPDGATVTLALHSPSVDGLLRPWDQPDRLVKHEWTSPPAISLLATNAQRVAVAPDGKTFFSGGLNGECWEMHEQSGDQRSNPSLRPTHSMAISPDGRRAVSAAGLEEGAVRVWHCRGHAAWAAPDAVMLLAHEEVRTAAFHPQDSGRVLTGGLDGTLRSWDLAGRDPVRRLPISVPVTAMAILPDGRRFITGSECGALQIWDLETGRELASLAGHRDEITTIDVSRDGRLALSAGYDFTARLWKLPPPPSAATPEEPKAQELLRKTPVPAPRTELNIQTAGTRMIVRDSDVRVTIETGDIHRRRYRDRVVSPARSPCARGDSTTGRWPRWAVWRRSGRDVKRRHHRRDPLRAIGTRSRSGSRCQEAGADRCPADPGI